MTGNILIKPSVQQKFDSVMQSGRILFFSAPCGFGKTALANALLRGHRTLRLCADAPDFTLRTLPKMCIRDRVYTDPVLGSINAYDDHNIHPVGYFHTA